MERVLFREFPECSEDGMRCPLCDFHCVHLVACVVDQLSDVTIIRGTGTTMHAQPSSPYRGSGIEIEAYCESGHRFTIALRFHKGSVLVTTTRLDDCPPDPDGGFIPPIDALRRD